METEYGRMCARAAGMPSGAMSARGVPGEMAPEALKKLVESHGAVVPHYDMYGHQHGRVPFKDKATFAEVPQKQEWITEPKYRTQSELMSARRAERTADPSFDLKGEGGVGPLDYFIGKTFDKDGDGRLNTAERANAVRELKNGFLNQYSAGHDRMGAQRPYPIVQKRGKIITVDNIHEVLLDTYPKHHNADNEPLHWTKKEMEMHRKAELKNSAIKLQEESNRLRPFRVPEPPVRQEGMVANPARTHIRQRREAHLQETRELGGLERDTTCVNPDRELLAPGVDYVQHPTYKNTTELLESRRQRQVQDLETQRTLGDGNFIPYAIRKARKEAEAFEYRRSDGGKTLTQLNEHRRQQRIEHDMANFHIEHGRPSYARYGNQDKGWWTLQSSFSSDPPSSLLKELNQPKEVSGKVTETVSSMMTNAAKQAELNQTREVLEAKLLEEAAKDAQINAVGGISDVTVQRWSEMFMEQERLKPDGRLFDGIVPAPTYATDADSLEASSSFSAIRKAHQNQEKDRWEKQSKADLERAAVRKGEKRATQTNEELCQSLASAGADLMKQASTQSISSRASSRLASMPLNARAARASGEAVVAGPRNLPLQEPIGEDIPMVERLVRAREYAGGFAQGSKPPTPRTPQVPKPGRPQAGSATNRDGAALPGKSARALAAAPTALNLDDTSAVVVRTGGFQWFDTQQRRENRSLGEGSRATPLNREEPSRSLLPTPRTRMTPRKLSEA